ncbi:MAG: hypothetical protein P8J32_08555 [bacterium]|nr:hypothetical protein [bacterium]
MERGRRGPEVSQRDSVETSGSHWEHQCGSCEHEGSTSFVDDGQQKKMDVYSCSDHFQPGVYGTEGTQREGDLIVVRYGESTNSSKGEIAYQRQRLDIERLRKDAKHRGKSNNTAAEIAVGKVL